MRYFVKLAYNGTPFFGWQIQPNHSSVQETLEATFSILLKEKIAITGCGRTDTGVHALVYYAHFDYHKELASESINQLLYQANSILPKEIVIYDIFEVDSTHHARFSALSRTYSYYICTKKDAFKYPFSYIVYQKLDVKRMEEATQILLDTKDFTSFSKLHTQVNNNHCRVSEVFWQKDDILLVFTITADRFLRNMVRAIVGTLLEVGLHKLTVADFQTIIDEKNRSKAGYSVPAHALFLKNVRYPFI